MSHVLFQSTLPQGERPRLQDGNLHDSVISIHAPARGATQKPIKVLKQLIISIHAPARGATVDRHYGQHTNWISIHAPARGATATE